MTVLDAPAPPRRQVKRWTKAEYHKLADGPLEGKRIYLYRGELIQMPAMGALHAIGIVRLTAWLVRSFDPAFSVRIQIPFELPDDSEPQPDGAVVTPEQNARRPHPNRAVLVVEVADSSIELDRDFADDYAAAGVPDFWIQNMRDREVEVFRDPVPDPASPTGWRYASHRAYRDGESVAPLARPEAVVPVSALTAVDVPRA